MFYITTHSTITKKEKEQCIDIGTRNMHLSSEVCLFTMIAPTHTHTLW